MSLHCTFEAKQLISFSLDNLPHKKRPEEAPSLSVCFQSWPELTIYCLFVPANYRGLNKQTKNNQTLPVCFQHSRASHSLCVVSTVESSQWLSGKIFPREFPRVIRKSDDPREFPRASFSDNH